MQQQETCTVSDAVEVQAAKPSQNSSEMWLSLKTALVPTAVLQCCELQCKRNQTNTNHLTILTATSIEGGRTQCELKPISE